MDWLREYIPASPSLGSRTVRGPPGAEAIYPSHTHLPPKVTALRDFLLESFAALPVAARGAASLLGD